MVLRALRLDGIRASALAGLHLHFSCKRACWQSPVTLAHSSPRPNGWMSTTVPPCGDFFDEHRVEVDAERYRARGTSEADRMRTHWELGANHVVGRVIGG